MLQGLNILVKCCEFFACKFYRIGSPPLETKKVQNFRSVCFFQRPENRGKIRPWKAAKEWKQKQVVGIFSRQLSTSTFKAIYEDDWKFPVKRRHWYRQMNAHGLPLKTCWKFGSRLNHVYVWECLTPRVVNDLEYLLCECMQWDRCPIFAKQHFVQITDAGGNVFSQFSAVFCHFKIKLKITSWPEFWRLLLQVVLQNYDRNWFSRKTPIFTPKISKNHRKLRS
jgi:hypothetical protein